MRLISASSWSNNCTNGVHNPNDSMLLALSSDSISCSKLSKATILFSRSTSGEYSAAMADFIRSASEGPPKREERTSGLRPREADSTTLLLLVVVLSWFWMLHLRRLFSLGSMVGDAEGIEETVVYENQIRSRAG